MCSKGEKFYFAETRYGGGGGGGGGAQGSSIGQGLRGRKGVWF